MILNFSEYSTQVHCRIDIKLFVQHAHNINFCCTCYSIFIIHSIFRNKAFDPEVLTPTQFPFRFYIIERCSHIIPL